MELNQVMQLTSTLKGCPLSCFFTFLLLPPPLSPKELVFITAYNIKTVRLALQKLHSVGLATTTGNEHWMLTDKGYQLPLGLTLPPSMAASVPKEVKIIPLLPRSSSTLISSMDSTHDKEQLLRQAKREKITSLLVDALVQDCACPTSLATDTIQEAIALAELQKKDINLEALYIEYDIYNWLAWCHDEKWGKGISKLGVFIAAKIKNLESPPDWFEPKFANSIYEKLQELELTIERKLSSEN